MHVDNDSRTSDEPVLRAYERIAETLRGLIDAGEFPEGAKLPSERELATTHGVSRPTVREALMALQAQEYVDIKVGSGAFVKERHLRKAAPVFNMGETLEEYVEARVLIEGVTLLQAIPLLKRSQIETLRATVAAMAKAIYSGESPIDADRDFHLTLASATKNAVLIRVVGELFDSRHMPLHSNLTTYSDLEVNWLMALEEHKAILEAVEKRDVVSAQTEIRHHIQASGNRWITFNLTGGT
jgi:GntR family transcriptional repressor for pyruvate dehydrogenase complex